MCPGAFKYVQVPVYGANKRIFPKNIFQICYITCYWMYCIVIYVYLEHGLSTILLE